MGATGAREFGTAEGLGEMGVVTVTVVASSRLVRTLSLSVVAVGASVAVPFLVHLLPGGQGVGASLLPIFWAPLLAVALLGPVPALVAATAAPALNHALTGMPPTFLLPGLTAELVVFTGLSLLAGRGRSVAGAALAAPAAYLIARWSVGVAGAALGGTAVDPLAPLAGLAGAAPGLVALAALGGLAAVGGRAAHGR